MPAHEAAGASFRDSMGVWLSHLEAEIDVPLRGSNLAIFVRLLNPAWVFRMVPRCAMGRLAAGCRM